MYRMLTLVMMMVEHCLLVVEDQPPLSMEVSTLQMAATHSPTGILLSTTIRTLPGKEHAMRRHLVQVSGQPIVWWGHTERPPPPFSGMHKWGGAAGSVTREGWGLITP